MPRWLKWILTSGIAVAAAVLLWQLLKPKNPVSYLTETVKRGRIEQSVSATGEIAPLQLVSVGAQASGQVLKLYVTLGQKVKKGALIAEIDAVSQQNALSSQQAQLKSYRAQLAAKQIALNVAQTQYTRELNLMKANATSQADVEAARNNLAATRAAVAELQAQIEQAKISVNTARTNLGYTRIIAPIDGTVVSLPIEEGQTLNSSMSTPVIAQIADLSQMLNKMQVAEGDATRIQAGMSVRFTTLADPDTTRQGTLKAVDPGLTAMTQGSYSPTTGSSNSAVYYYARAVVPNDDGKLYIGMTTQNTIVIKSVADVLVLPSQTLHRKDGKTYVTVLNSDNSTREVEVQTGAADSLNTEIRSGLSEGQKVVADKMSAEEITQSNKNTMRGGPPPH